MSVVALGFDFGEKRIGMAIGNQTTGTSRALGWIATPHNDDGWRDIETAVHDWQPQVLLIGVPLTEDGGKQPMSRKARHFGHQLRERFHLPVCEIDERYSSTAADAALVEARRGGQRTRKLQRGDTDSAAASLIVQQWLDQA